VVIESCRGVYSDFSELGLGVEDSTVFEDIELVDYVVVACDGESVCCSGPDLRTVS